VAAKESDGDLDSDILIILFPLIVLPSLRVSRRQKEQAENKDKDKKKMRKSIKYKTHLGSIIPH
jgi:hypothetical protein